MDWVTGEHKRAGCIKWTVSVMLWLLQCNKSCLKAPLLSSLIPAGGLGCTKPLEEWRWQNARTVVWTLSRGKKNSTNISISLYSQNGFLQSTIQESIDFFFFLEDSENAERSRRGSGGAGQLPSELPTKVRCNKWRGEIHWGLCGTPITQKIKMVTGVTNTGAEQNVPKNAKLKRQSEEESNEDREWSLKCDNIFISRCTDFSLVLFYREKLIARKIGKLNT